MSPKLNKEDRLKIVERVKKGEPVFKVCTEAGISRVLYYRWYKKYKEEGARGLNPGEAGRPELPGAPKKVKEYNILSPHARSLMVREVVEQNQDPSEVAKRYNISRVTLYKWIGRYKEDIAKGVEPDMSSRKPYIERYFRQVPERHELAVIQLVEQHPEWGIRRIVANLPKVAGLPIVGHHGVQNILDRHNLSTYELRLAYAGSRITPVTKGIGEVLVKVSEFFRIPPENRKIFIRAFTGISLGLFSLIATLGVIGYFARSFTQVSGASPLGLSFSAVALLMGTIFLLYSFKYYFSIAMVLSFSQTQKGVERKRGVGLTPDLSHIKLLDRPFVSVHIPFYNEKYVVERVMEAASGFDYPEYEVILCDDSTDETSEIISNYLHANGGKVEKRSGNGWELQSAEIKPGVTFKHLHRTTRGGYKGGALGLALKLMDPRTEYVSIFDADFVPYPDTLELFLKYFQVEGYKPEVAAVQGYQWHVLNKSENWITRGVRTEYSGSYVIERSGTEIYGGLKQISGSVYMIKKSVLQEIGWGTSITEDFELTLRLYAQGYKVLYTPYIQAPAECVSTIRRLVRQRMRWAEGHSANIKKMFFKLLGSPKLSLAEKFEFVYLSPYYLQAFFFLVGTICWLLSEAIFKARLPFWTELWGWSLVLTNVISLPLLNAVGMFLEESGDRDYLGLASFVALSYILVPFQAYASLKGLLEEKEGPWFRTPKTGRITDVFRRGKFYKFISGILPGKTAEPAPSTGGLVPGEAHDVEANYYLNLNSANSTFNDFRIKSKRTRWIGQLVLTLVLIVSLLLNSMAFIIRPAKAAGWLTDWSYRKKVTISNTNVDANLSNFPLLVKIAESGGDSTNIGYNVSDTTHGYDIRFTDSDGTTLLSYERESFSIASSNLTAIFWVKVPTVNHSTTTDIYIYYTNSGQAGSDWTATTGSGNCSTITQAQCTWKENSSQNFKAVWHLKETGTNPTIYDSTANANTSTTQTWTPASGKIDGAGNNTGSQWVEFNANTVFLNATSAHTTSFWVNVTSYSGHSYPTPINIKTNTDYYAVYISDQSSYEGVTATQVGTAGWRASGTSAALVGTWSYITAVFDGVDRTNVNSWKIYVNGVSKSLTTGGGWNTLADNILYTDDKSVIDTLYGSLDEMRVAQVARPAEWVKFEYYNHSSANNELTFAAQETPELVILLLPFALVIPAIIKYRERRKYEENL
jgi:cellulose synthase/poly-beta-1,6-N-acetylglucosamine synthase-like glycosyltransferase/transposase-like protein